jgi:hypothetical protein
MKYKTMYNIYIIILKLLIFIRIKILNIFYILKIKIPFYKKKIIILIMKYVCYFILLFSIIINLIVLDKLKQLNGKVLIDKDPYAKIDRILIEPIENTNSDKLYQITFLSMIGDGYFITTITQKELDYIFKKTNGSK